MGRGHQYSMVKGWKAPQKTYSSQLIHAAINKTPIFGVFFILNCALFWHYLRQSISFF